MRPTRDGSGDLAASNPSLRTRRVSTPRRRMQGVLLASANSPTAPAAGAWHPCGNFRWNFGRASRQSLLRGSKDLCLVECGHFNLGSLSRKRSFDPYQCASQNTRQADIRVHQVVRRSLVCIELNVAPSRIACRRMWHSRLKCFLYQKQSNKNPRVCEP